MINEESAQASLIASKLAYSYGPLGGQLPGYQWVAEISDVGTGFHSQVFKNSANEYIVAFTGTEGVFKDAYTDLNLGWTQWSGKREEVFQLLRDLKANGELASVNFTGHSLGGGLAQYAAYEYVNELEPAPFSLTTFNAFGGVEGIRQKLNGYDSARLEGIDVNHFRVASDMVSRIGGAHVGGNVRVIDFPTPDFIAAHVLDQSFLFPAYAGYQLTALPSVTPAYLHISNGQQIGAAMANLFARGIYSEVSAGLRVGAGLLVILKLAPAAEIDAVVDAMYPQYAQVNWGRVVSALPFSGGAAVLGGVGLVLAAGVYEGLQLAVDHLGEIKSFLGEVVGENFDGMASLPAGEASLRMSLYLAATSGIGLAGSVLGQTLATISIDQSQLTARLLSGANWLENSLEYLRGQALTTGQNVANFSARVAQGIYKETQSLGETTGTLLSDTLTTLGGFLNYTAQGIGNAFSELLNKIPGVLDLGRTLGFGEYKTYEQAYEQALQDRTIDSALRSVLEDAKEIVQRAGQTVVVESGIGPNPFDTAGFDPAAAPLATGTVKEKSVNTFTAYLPFQAGTGGQSIQLALNGLGTGTVTVLSSGQELTPVNGVVTLVMAEGQQELQFALRAQSLSADATVALDAQLVDSTGAATHQSHQEATITAVNTPAINYANGFTSQVYTGTESDDVRDLLGSFNYVAHGNGGNDLIFSRAGNDQLYGDAGNDSLFGFVGHDQLFGGTGRDLLIADFCDDYAPPSGDVAGEDIVDGGTEDDVVAGGGGDDELYGGTGNDHLWGDNLVEGDGALPGDPGSGLRATYFFRAANTSGDDYLDGGGGDDLLLGNLGDDVLLGGAGADKLLGDQVPGDSGAPVSFAEFNGGADFLDGGDGNDLLQGDGGDDVLWGGAGNDQLYGDDRVAGAVTPGNDWLEGGAGDDLLVGGAGDDLLDGGVDIDQLFGEEGDDVLDGGDGADQLSGGIGNDDLYGGTGNDILAGHDGMDLLLGEAGADQLDGGNDNDELFGGAGNDVLFGQAGDDYLDGEANDDELQGGAGVDTLIGNVGNDRLFGDAGNDQLFGDEGDDVLDGGEGDNVLLGGDGHDQLIGGSGADQVHGGVGNDVLAGGGGADTYVIGLGDGIDMITDSAGEGNWVMFVDGITSDDVTVTFSPTALVLRLGPAGNQLSIGEFNASHALAPSAIASYQFADGAVLTHADLVERGAGIEAGSLAGWELSGRLLVGSSGNDWLGATTLNDLLSGAEGDDLLAGLDGDDVILGGAGRDELAGDHGNDVLEGGAGDDYLDGGQFGEGGDTYRYNLGDGLDIVFDGPGFGSEINRLQFGAGITSASLSVAVIESLLTIRVGRNGAGVQFWNTQLEDVLGRHDIQLFSFADSTSMTYEQLVAQQGLIDVMSSVLGYQEVLGTNLGDRVFAGAGDQFLFGREGDDTYLFNLGDGIDTIEDVATLGEGNRVQFGVGIRPIDLTFTEDSVARTLTIQVGSGTDQLMLMNFDPTGVNGSLVVETLAFADGSEESLASLIGPSITIFGTEAADVLVGTTENDGIDAGAGPDTIYAGSGDDLILAGAGDDVVAGEAGGDTIHGGSGVDYLYGGDGDDLINGDEDPDVLVGDAGHDTLTGGAGNDVLNGGIGHDHLIGGDGDDTIYAGVGDDLIEAGDGNDAVVGEEGADAISGGAGADYLYGGDGDDLVNGDDGGDVLVGEVGNDTLNGGLGDDVLNGGDDEDVLSGEDGNDTVYAGMGNDVISGGAGDDAVNGDDGADTLSGGIGADSLYGGNGDDSINGDEGNDTLVGEDGLDVLAGGAGSDVLKGGIGADQLYGEDGDDTLYIDAADTVVNGGNGYDVVVVTGIDGVTFDVAGAGIELMAGSVGNDVFTAVGSSNSITFYGGDGTDQLTGGNANDVLVGDGGDDLLSGGDGNDVLNGGVGDDTLTGGAGDDAFYAGAGTDLISGGDGTDSVSGDEGNDVIAGGADGDYLYGGIGDDVINGEAGNDVLVGEADHDTLAGGAGNDRLVGGTGNDVYCVGIGGGRDVIAEDDSTSGNQDLLQFDSELTPLDLVLSQQANDLRIAMHGTADQILLENWFMGEAYQVESLEAGTGVTLLNSQVDQLIQAMASFSQQTGLTWDQAIDQRPQEVQAVLAASWQ